MSNNSRIFLEILQSGNEIGLSMVEEEDDEGRSWGSTG